MIVMSASFWYVILDEQPYEVFPIFTVGFRFVFGSGHSVKSYASHFPIKIYLYSLFFSGSIGICDIFCQQWCDIDLVLSFAELPESFQPLP